MKVKAHETTHRRALVAAAASALALGLAACSEQTASDGVARIPDPAKSPGSQLDRAADSAGRSLDQAENVVREKTAEAGKVLEDATITAKVKSTLVAEPGLKALGINVDTFAGVVTLRGTADSNEKRQKAEQLAATVEGVRSVKNELVVIPG